MSTTIRPEISKKKDYYIPKHRYYELKHYVQQYKDFQDEYNNATYGFQKSPPPDYIFINEITITKPTEKMALYRNYFWNKLQIINNAANEADPVIGPKIVQNIVDGLSWDTCKDQVPCCREEYYYIYRKFFWILSRVKS